MNLSRPMYQLNSKKKNKSSLFRWINL